MFVVAAPMVAAAGSFGDRYLVFPKGASLAFGVVATRVPAWRSSRLNLAVVPSGCAALGVALDYVIGPRWVVELVALAGGFALLGVFRSRLTPSISAALFPLVFDVRSWVFPAVVAVVCVTLALLAGRCSPSPTPAHTGLPSRTVLAAGVMLAGWIIVAGQVLGLPAAALAQPLFVAAIEWLSGAETSLSAGIVRWAGIFGAAALGAVLASTVRPAWAGGLVALAVTMVVLAVTSARHPPALAVCLIPQVAAGSSPGGFVAAVAAGAAVLYLSASFGHAFATRAGPGFSYGRSRRSGE